MKKWTALLLALVLTFSCALAEDEMIIVHATDMHYFSPRSMTAVRTSWRSSKPATAR